MLKALNCDWGSEGPNHSWGTQKECLTPKLLLGHNFKWPLRLPNYLFINFTI